MDKKKQFITDTVLQSDIYEIQEKCMCLGFKTAQELIDYLYEAYSHFSDFDTFKRLFLENNQD